MVMMSMSPTRVPLAKSELITTNLQQPDRILWADPKLTTTLSTDDQGKRLQK